MYTSAYIYICINAFTYYHNNNNNTQYQNAPPIKNNKVCPQTKYRVNNSVVWPTKCSFTLAHTL